MEWSILFVSVWIGKCLFSIEIAFSCITKAFLGDRIILNEKLLQNIKANVWLFLMPSLSLRFGYLTNKYAHFGFLFISLYIHIYIPLYAYIVLQICAPDRQRRDMQIAALHWQRAAKPVASPGLKLEALHSTNCQMQLQPTGGWQVSNSSERIKANKDTRQQFVCQSVEKRARLREPKGVAGA